MNVVAISDLHGFLPETPPCDLLLIAGDVCPVWNHRWQFQRKWLREVFGPWLEAQPARKVVLKQDLFAAILARIARLAIPPPLVT